MTPVDAIWLLLVKTQPLPATLWLPALPPPSHPVGMLVVLTTPVKNYLKWRAIQLAIHSTVGAQIEYKQLQNRGEFHASIYFPSQDTTLQIIKVGISKDL